MRHKDVEWDLATDINANGNPEGLARRQVAVLMDIRDELQTLNALLGCRNFVEVPSILRTIREHTKPKKRTREKS